MLRTQTGRGSVLAVALALVVSTSSIEAIAADDVCKNARGASVGQFFANLGKSIAELGKGLVSLVTALPKSIGGWADKAKHRLDGFETCLHRHVPRLALESADKVLSFYQKMKQDMSTIQGRLRCLTPEHRPQLQNTQFSPLRDNIKRGIFSFRRGGVQHARSWFGSDAKRDKAERQFLAIFDKKAGKFSAELDAFFDALLEIIPR